WVAGNHSAIAQW
ncbi:unnamed protein product, partial [Diplocarpon coronariae]